MEETRTGGGKEFVFSMIWAVVLLFIGKILIEALPNYKIIGTVITILMFCVLGFFVLTRYSAIFTYSLKNDRLRVNRKIGHRNKEVDFAMSSVKSVTKHRPDKAPKNIQNMKNRDFNIWNVKRMLSISFIRRLKSLKKMYRKWTWLMIRR